MAKKEEQVNAKKKKKKSRQKKAFLVILDKVNKIINFIFLIFFTIIVVFFIMGILKLNNLSTSIENLSNSYQELKEENISLKTSLNEMIQEVYSIHNRFENNIISKEQFTEIYMQLQELTGMISEENKREFYISRIVNIISNHNKDLESETIYEVAKHIYENSVKYGINPLLTSALIKVESNFDTEALSEAYAFGLCQVRRFIAKELAENIGIKWDGAENTLFDPENNIRIGLHYLSLLYEDFGDMKLALAAYNHGPFKIQEILLNDSEIPNSYTEKVLKNYAQFRGFDYENIDDLLYHDQNGTY